MSDTSIFEINDVQVDMKNYTKLRCKSALNDSVIFKFLVYNDNAPVNLNDYNIELRARLPKSGQIYSEVDNITKSGNLLTIICDSRLCNEIGEVMITLRLWDNTYKQKSNYLIVLKVMSTIDSDEKIADSSVLSALNSLDFAVDRYLELKVDLLDQITIGNTLLTNLISNIATGNTLNTSLIKNMTDGTILNNSLITQNTQANNNIPILTKQNNTATNNIPILTTKNAEAVTNNANLTNTNNQSNILYSNLHTENGIGTKLLSDLKDANSDINKKIDDHINDNMRHLNIGEREQWNLLKTQMKDVINLLDTTIEGKPVTDENGVVITEENGVDWTV